MWIPFHIGISGNKLADELAIKTIKSPNCQQYLQVTYEDTTQALKTKYNCI